MRINTLILVPQPKAKQIRPVNRNLRLAVSSRLAHKAAGIINIEDNGIGREAAVISKAKNGKGSKLIGVIGNERDNNKVIKRYR